MAIRYNGNIMGVVTIAQQRKDEDKALVDWLQRIPIPSAVDYIAQEWGLTYRFV